MILSQLSFRKRVKSGKELNTFLRTKKFSAYDSVFEQHLIDHDVYSDEYDDVRNAQEPHNWKEIHVRLTVSWASLSSSCFSRETFLDFKEKNQDALTESQVISKTFSIIADTIDILLQQNLWFENLKDLINDFITKTQLNFYDETRSEELNKQIREELESYIVSSTNTAASCLLNFFMKGKSSKKNTLTCKNQASYDNALNAREVHKLWSYVDSETTYNNNAYAIISTYHDDSETLIVYTIHVVTFKNSKHQIEYHMTQLNSFAMINNSNTFQ